MELVKVKKAELLLIQHLGPPSSHGINSAPQVEKASLTPVQTLRWLQFQFQSGLTCWGSLAQSGGGVVKGAGNGTLTV